MELMMNETILGTHWCRFILINGIFTKNANYNERTLCRKCTINATVNVARHFILFNGKQYDFIAKHLFTNGVFYIFELMAINCHY